MTLGEDIVNQQRHAMGQRKRKIVEESRNSKAEKIPRFGKTNGKEKGSDSKGI